MESKKSRKILIAGSARKDGGVAELIEFFLKHSDWDVVDLNDYQFSYYDYDHANREDDFIPLIRTIVEKYDTWIFLTPVYWYAMSGIMKVFFDRFTDLLEIEKPLGRQLRKIKMAAISSSVGNHLGDVFWLPFSETAKYFGMQYLGNIHTIAGKQDTNKLKSFIHDIEKQEKDPG